MMLQYNSNWVPCECKPVANLFNEVSFLITNGVSEENAAYIFRAEGLPELNCSTLKIVAI
jgi:hypothetical protein